MKKIISKIRNSFYSLIFIFLILGCASRTLPPTQKLIQITYDDAGAVKIFNYPYKQVFYSSEDAMLNCSAHPYLVSESSIEEGYILATRRGDPIFCGSVMVIIEKIDDNNTKVIMRGFRDIRWQVFYKQFFKRLSMNLERYSFQNK